MGIRSHLSWWLLAATVFQGAAGAGRASSQMPDEGIPVEVQRQIERLDAPDPAVRIEAIRQLRDMERPAGAVVERLAALLYDEEFITDSTGWKTYVGYEALRALERMGKPAVPALIAALDSESGEVRLRAVLGLGRIGGPEIGESFAAMLDDPEPRVRIHAVDALGRLKDARHYERIAAALKDPDGRVGAGAARALTRMGDPRAVEPLIEAVLRGEPWLATAAVEALGAFEDARAVDPLLSVLTAESTLMRARAARALGALRSPKAVDPLIAALDDSERDVRVAAAVALDELREPRAVEGLAKLLTSPPEELWPTGYGVTPKSAAATALGKLGNAGEAALLDALNHKNGRVRYLAAATLWRDNTLPTFEAVVATVGDPEWRVRAYVVRRLASRRDPRGIGPLTTAMGDERPEIRRTAVEGLAALRDPRTVEPLIAALADPDAEAAQRAAEALGRARDARAVEPLIEAMKTRTGAVRIACAEALAQSRDSRSIEPLRTLLRSSSREVRRSVAEILGRMGEGAAAAVPDLIALLGEREKVERLYVGSRRMEPGWSPAMALAHIGTPAVERLLEVIRNPEGVSRDAPLPEGFVDDGMSWAALSRRSRWEFRAAATADEAAWALGRIGDARAVEPLIEAIVRTARPDPQPNDDASEVQSGRPTIEQMTERLAKGQSLQAYADAVAPLVTALDDDCPNVRAVAATGLGKTQDARAVEPLLQALEASPGSSDSQAIIRALAACGDPRAVEPLIAMVKTRRGSLNDTVIQALGELGDRRAVAPLVEAACEASFSGDRRAIARALGKLGDPRGIEPLMAMLEDERTEDHYSVALAARFPTAGMLEEFDRCVVRAASTALGAMGRRATPALVTALGHRYWTVREAACHALATIADPEAVGAIIAALDDEQWAVRAGAAAAALGAIGDPAAVEPLNALADDLVWDVRSAAERALEQCRPESNQMQQP